MLRGKKLRNSLFYEEIVKAIRSGNLNRGNVRDWVIEFNGLYDETLEKEVWCAIRIYVAEGGAV